MKATFANADNPHVADIFRRILIRSAQFTWTAYMPPSFCALEGFATLFQISFTGCITIGLNRNFRRLRAEAGGILENEIELQPRMAG